MLTSDGLGTYTPTDQVLASPTTAALILYDSKNYLRQATGGGTGSFGAIGGAARAAGRKAICHATRGMILIDTSSWAVNNQLIMGFRIGVYEQDPGNGQMSVEPGYSMFLDASDVPISYWANAKRRNLWERRMYHQYGQNSDTAGLYMLSVKARFRAYLDDNECLAIFAECPTGSVNVRIKYFLSTLVTDEG